MRSFISLFFVLFVSIFSVAAQTTDSTTGMVSPSYYGTGSPTKTCSATNLAGIIYFQTDSTTGRMWGCMLALDNVTWTWIHFTVPILGATTSFGGSALLLGGSVSTTTTVTGAVTGSNCEATRADGTLLAVGLIIDCAVTSTNTVTVRISAALAGTPSAGIYNIKIVQ